MSAAKTPFRVLLKRLGLYGAYKLKTDSYLRELGWYRSFDEQRPVNGRGDPLPWITYPASELLTRRVRPDDAVFEYGAGMSTFWWAERVRRVVAIEHDLAWYEKLRGRLPANVELLHQPLEYGGAYCRGVLADPGAFSLVVIDGRDRVACARHAVKGLTAGGVIVWDDTDRSQYREGIEFLHAEGFRSVEFVGMTPAATHAHETTIFYRDGNCLGL